MTTAKKARGRKPAAVGKWRVLQSNPVLSSGGVVEIVGRRHGKDYVEVMMRDRNKAGRVTRSQPIYFTG